MTATFRITPRAHEDLKNIGRYTVRTWGKVQRDRYLEASITAFRCLPRTRFQEDIDRKSRKAITAISKGHM